MFAVAFFFFVLPPRPAFAALGWVGNMYPRPGNGSPVYITEGASQTVYVQVWKNGVTNSAGQGANISCTLYYGQVSAFGGTWYNNSSLTMTYNTDIGNNDEYKGTFTPAVGLWEFTASCTDTTDNHTLSQADGNGQLYVKKSGSSAGNCDIAWNPLLHDTFNADYREVVGPIAAGSVTQLRLRLRTGQNDIRWARVRVWDDRLNTQNFYNMLWDGSFDNDPTTYDWWTVDLPIGSSPTVYYYLFEVGDNDSSGNPCDVDFYTDDNVKFYGGGYGAGADNFTDTASFQITVYDPAFGVPAWMQQGIVYQIYPDRFRDGNASNNPSAPRFFYNEAGQTIYRSNSTTWNKTICDPRGLSAPNNCTGYYSSNFYGGDLQGITDKINQGYFDNLGVSVLYLNPIFKSPSNHRYDTDDYLTIDPDFGTLTDWNNLVSAANAHNIKIILDGVFNHTSSDSKYFDRYGRFAETGACESTASAYRNWYYFSDAHSIGAPGRDGDPNSGTLVYCADNPPGRTYEAWYGYSSLPKLQANTTAVRNLIWNNGLSSVGPYWTNQGASGWRFDVGADVDPGLTNDASNDYWEGFRGAVRAYNSQALTLGEEWGDASAWLLGNEWDSVMNYRFRSAVLAWLFTGCVSGEGCNVSGTSYEENDSNSASSSGAISYISPSQFNARLRSIQEDYPPMAFKAMMNLEGSHDTQRIRFLLKKINNNNDTAAVQRMKEWWLFAFTYAGAPTLYYGDEVGLSQDGVWDSGSGRTQDDPYNRAPFPWDDTPGDFTANTSNLLPFARKMASLRLAYPVLQDGDVQHGIVIDDANKLYGFARTNGSQTALIVLNRDGVSHNATISGLNAAPYNLSNGTVLYDAMEGNTYTVSGGSVTVPVNPTWGVVLLQQTAVQTPSVPAQFTVTPNGSQNILAWNSVTTDTNGGRELAYQYTVHRSTTQGFTPNAGNKIADVTPPNFGSTNGRVTYTDTNPPAPMEGPNATNYYAVCAQNAGGGQNCTATAAPTALDLIAFDARVKQNQVRLKWETGAELNVLGFNVLRRQGKQGEWTRQNAQMIPAQSPGQMQGNAYAYQDAPNAGTYFYRLEIVRADGASTQSEAVRVRVAASCPARPTLVSPQADAEISARRVALDWNNDACAKTWDVMVRADNPQGAVVFKRTGLTQSNVTTAKLKAGKTYVWRVAACGDNGCARSAWTTFHIAASALE
jgi:glycosidase